MQGDLHRGDMHRGVFRHGTIHRTVRAAALACAANIPVAALAADNALLPRDLSPWGMFMGADIVVKAVMIGLAFASQETWTVWLAKTI